MAKYSGGLLGKAYNEVGNFVSRGADKVDSRLRDIHREAANRFPDYEVHVYSGYRPGDTRRHGKQIALDVALVDKKTGQVVPNYQDAKTFRTYEQYAQVARQVQQEKYPELDDKFTWGGYFSGPVGKYGAVDLMHFDLGGVAAGGTWEDGLTAAQRALLPGVESVGMNHVGLPGTMEGLPPTREQALESIAAAQGSLLADNAAYAAYTDPSRAKDTVPALDSSNLAAQYGAYRPGTVPQPALQSMVATRPEGPAPTGLPAALQSMVATRPEGPAPTGLPAAQPRGIPDPIMALARQRPEYTYDPVGAIENAVMAASPPGTDASGVESAVSRALAGEALDPRGAYPSALGDGMVSGPPSTFSRGFSPSPSTYSSAGLSRNAYDTQRANAGISQNAYDTQRSNAGVSRNAYDTQRAAPRASPQKVANAYTYSGITRAAAPSLTPQEQKLASAHFVNGLSRSVAARPPSVSLPPDRQMPSGAVRPSIPAPAPSTAALAAQYGQYRSPTSYAGVKNQIALDQALEDKVLAEMEMDNLTAPALTAPAPTVAAPPLAPPTVVKNYPVYQAPAAPVAPPAPPAARAYDVYSGMARSALDNTGMNTVGRLDDGTTTVTNQYGARTGMTPGGYQTAVGAGAISGPLGQGGIETPSVPSQGGLFSKVGSTAKGFVNSPVTKGAAMGATVGGIPGAVIGGLLGAAMRPGGALSGSRNVNTSMANALGLLDGWNIGPKTAFYSPVAGGRFPGAPSNPGTTRGFKDSATRDHAYGMSPGAAAAIDKGLGGLY